MKTLPCLVALVAALMASGCAEPTRSRALSDPRVTGATLAQQVCVNCHGPHGRAVSPNFPILAAQQHDYLVAELTSLRDKHRRDPAGYVYMWGIARNLTDKQIAEIADYYSSQAPMPTRPTPAQSLDAGKVLFTQGAADRGIPACMGCHGPRAEGQGGFPRLAGQHANYLRRQLHILMQSTDQRPLGVVMNPVAHQMTEADIDAVTNYLESM